MSVKRYCPTGCEVGCDVYCTPVGMAENAGGDYVRYIDFASVKAERDALSAELAGHTHEVSEGEDRVTCDEAVAYWRELGDRACANEVLIHGALARLRAEQAAATARAEAAEALQRDTLRRLELEQERGVKLHAMLSRTRKILLPYAYRQVFAPEHQCLPMEISAAMAADDAAADAILNRKPTP